MRKETTRKKVLRVIPNKWRWGGGSYETQKKKFTVKLWTCMLGHWNVSLSESLTSSNKKSSMYICEFLIGFNFQCSRPRWVWSGPWFEECDDQWFGNSGTIGLGVWGSTPREWRVAITGVRRAGDWVCGCVCVHGGWNWRESPQPAIAVLYTMLLSLIHSAEK